MGTKRGEKKSEINKWMEGAERRKKRSSPIDAQRRGQRDLKGNWGESNKMHTTPQRKKGEIGPKEGILLGTWRDERGASGCVR